MASPILGANGQPLSGLVIDPSVSQYPVGSAVPLGMGKHGQQIISPLHGSRFQAASRGNRFVASTAIAGVTLPAPATTLASKAGMHNPLGSGVNVELVAIGLTAVTIDVALKNFLMEFQVKATQTGGAPTSVTQLTSYSMPLSKSLRTAGAYAYSAATMTNAAANPILIPFVPKLETAVGSQQVYFRFDGEIVMGPDTVMAITCTAALAAVNLTYLWAEWPE
jgi:hypothetical protein